MEAHDKIEKILTWFTGLNLWFVAAAMTLVLYFVYKKSREMDRNAIQNSAASIVLSAINVGVAVMFNKEIYTFAQSCYDALGIPTLPHDFWNGTNVIVTIVVVFAARDFCDYMIHRAMHMKWLWPTHAAHHSDTHVNGFSTFRIHYLEGLVMDMNYLVVLTWLQLPHLIPLVAIVGPLHNMYIHLDLPYTHGPLKYLIASPVFHRWHHADVPEAHGKNLANLMPIYDVIFGTYYAPGPCTAKLGALSTGLEDKNPILIWIYPFQEWARLIRKAFGRLSARRSADKNRAYPDGLPPAE